MTAAYTSNTRLRATDSSVPFGTNEAKKLMHRHLKIGSQKSANGSRIRCSEVKVDVNLLTQEIDSDGNGQRPVTVRKSSKK